MNCSQAAEQEALLNKKDAKIASLQWRLTMVESTFFDFLARESVGDITGKEPLLVSPTPGPRVRLRFSHVPVTDGTARRSKPLPVDAFTGESAELQYEDWLP